VADSNRRRRSVWQTVALFAVIGLIINVLLAWMFALLASPTEYQEKAVGWYGYPEDFPPVWECDVPSGWPTRCRHSVFGSTRGLTWYRGIASDEEGDAVIDYEMTEVQVGWPFRSVRWRHGQVFDRHAATTEFIGGWWIPIPDWLEQLVASSTSKFHARRRLPIEPMWLGLLANTAMFGGTLWLLLRLRRTVRRWLRHRRQQCLECGYPIGRSELCTECGTPLAANPTVKPTIADRP